MDKEIKESITFDEAMKNEDLVNAVCDLMDKHEMKPNLFQSMYLSIQKFRDEEASDNMYEYYERVQMRDINEQLIDSQAKEIEKLREIQRALVLTSFERVSET